MRRALTVMLCSVACAGAEIRVPSDYPTIHEAVAAAVTGDTVRVAPGVYPITATIRIEKKTITLRSEGDAGNTVLEAVSWEGSDFDALLLVYGRSRIEGFSLRGARSYGASLQAGAELAACNVTDCVRGVAAWDSTVRGCVIARNRRGGVLADGDLAVIEDCTIEDNGDKAYMDGGITASGDCLVANCRILRNAAVSGGGVSDGPLRMTDCVIVENEGEEGHGAGVSVQDATLTNCLIARNVGRGITCRRGTVTLNRCTIAGNTSTGIYMAGSVVLHESIVWDNAGGSFWMGTGGSVTGTRSCTQTDTVCPGTDNITTDPLFAGWAPAAEVYVDAAAPPGGDGSAVNPYSALRDALNFDLRLAQDSPCLTLGGDGGPIGADLGVVPGGALARRLVRLAPGTYAATRVILTHGVSLQGSGREDTIIRGGIVGSRTGTTVSRLTVMGADWSGIRIARDESPEIRDVVVKDNRGIGVFCWEQSRPVVRDSAILGNTGWSYFGGGGIHCAPGSAPSFINCLVADNVANEGGAAYCGGTSAPVFEHCTISGNCGGFVHKPGAAVQVKSCIVWDNSGSKPAPLDPPAAAVSFSCIESAESFPGEGNIAVDPRFCGWRGRTEIFVDDDAPAGGNGTSEFPYRDLAAALDYSLALAEGSPCVGTGEGGTNMGADLGVESCEPAAACTIRIAAGSHALQHINLAHRASLAGSGEASSELVGRIRGLRSGAFLSHLTVRGGADGYGGISIDGDESPTILHTTVTESVARGIYCARKAAPTIASCTLIRNVGSGAIACDFGAVVELSDSLIAQNSTVASGGGISAIGAVLRMTRCIVMGNLAYSSAGGIYGGEGVELANCIIVGNRATSGSGALGGYGGAMRLVNCTLAWNPFGEFSSSDDCPSMRNCIVWQSPGRAACSDFTACLVDVEPRFVRDGTFDFGRTTQIVTNRDRIYYLPDFVIETPDVHLLADSPAIDGGSADGAPSDDMDGRLRDCGLGVDIGAYEWCPGMFVRGDANADRKFNIADAVFTLQYLFAGGGMPSCMDAADANDDGTLNISDGVQLLAALFRGRTLPAPYPECGGDPTGDALASCTYPVCE